MFGLHLRWLFSNNFLPLTLWTWVCKPGLVRMSRWSRWGCSEQDYDSSLHSWTTAWKVCLRKKTSKLGFHYTFWWNINQPVQNLFSFTKIWQRFFLIRHQINLCDLQLMLKIEMIFEMNFKFPISNYLERNANIKLDYWKKIIHCANFK